MSEMVQIRSVKQYFQDFIIKGLEGKTRVDQMDIIPIKQAMLDAFRKEIFGQIVFKLGPETAEMSRDDLAGLDTVHNILVQSFRKWRRICMLAGDAGLGSFFHIEDLKKTLEEEEAPDGSTGVNIPDAEKDVTDDSDYEGIVITEEETHETPGNAEAVRYLP